MNRNAFIGIAERVIATFVAAFFALYLPAVLSASSTGGWHALLNLSVAQKAAVAGAAAVFSLIKSVAATQVGNPNSGGMLPDRLMTLLKAIPWGSGQRAPVPPVTTAPPQTLTAVPPKP
jgi:hypothetical protein